MADSNAGLEDHERAEVLTASPPWRDREGAEFTEFLNWLMKRL